ncbi:hypothetical protein KRR55_10425 [Paeniglutamicibacter sp. ABSL32-1]|uniref:glycine betaine ABC transporter substrate-binding protein n=1 Tax=Paeniglutamicibacter quisquiliarum TaxID=2849498 RepID=UPI001C2D86BB|nr:glycine betaine ABC transporter substrate-binding protein [Paeniglutamicibacter quisquiliarum]MBV1779525.1 hypothetical protein [Paeniglutamicibacter quisquiliarum]
MMENNRPRRAGGLRVLGLGALLLALAGCTSGTEVPTSQAQTERELLLVQRPDATSQALGHAYKDILADAGVSARLAPPAADPVAEVLAGRADLAVAGSSDLLAALGKLPGAQGAADGSASTPTEGGGAAGPSDAADGPGDLDAATVTKQLHALKPAGFAVLDTAEAERTGTLVVTAATSAREKLLDIDQLGALCPRLEFGISRAARASLVPALATKASCTPKSVAELTDEQARGVMPVISDAVQVQATTLENAGIPDNALVVLQRAGTLFAPQAVTPLITTDGVGQDAIKAINKLSAALKQEDLLELNRMVSGRDALEAHKAAADWLADKSLVSAP